MAMRDRGDCRDVLDLEGQRARRLAVDDLGVGPHQPGDALADQWGVIGRLDAAFLEDALAEIARRAIGAVDHQAMVAGAEQRLQRPRYCRQTGRYDHAAVAALNFSQQLFEREGGRRAVQAVADDAKRRRRALRLPLRHVLREDRRGVVDRRVDDAEIGLGIAADMGEQRVLAIVARPVVVFHSQVLGAFCGATEAEFRSYCPQRHNSDAAR